MNDGRSTNLVSYKCFVKSIFLAHGCHSKEARRYGLPYCSYGIRVYHWSVRVVKVMKRNQCTYSVLSPEDTLFMPKLSQYSANCFHTSCVCGVCHISNKKRTFCVCNKQICTCTCFMERVLMKLSKQKAFLFEAA